MWDARWTLACVPWEQCIQEMDADEIYWDEITLRVILNCFNIEVCIVSTLGKGWWVKATDYFKLLGRICLCHYITIAANNEVNDATDGNVNNRTHNRGIGAIEDNEATDDDANRLIVLSMKTLILLATMIIEAPPITTLMILPMTTLAVLAMTMSILLLISRLMVLPMTILKMLLITTLLLQPITMLMELPKISMLKWLQSGGTFKAPIRDPRQDFWSIIGCTRFPVSNSCLLNIQ